MLRVGWRIKISAAVIECEKASDYNPTAESTIDQMLPLGNVTGRPYNNGAYLSIRFPKEMSTDTVFKNTKKELCTYPFLSML